MTNETKQQKSSENKLVPSVKINIGTIEFDKEKIESQLNEILEEYKDLDVTEDNLGEAKQARADINKLTQAMNRVRIDKKKEWMKPFKEVEEDMKDVISNAEEVSESINEKVSEFDEKRKQEKIDIANNIIESAKELSDLPKEYLERIEFKDSFSNLSTSKKAIEEDVDSQIEQLEKEYTTFNQNVKVIESTIESVNKDIKTELYPEDYINLLKNGEEVGDVVEKINTRKEQIIEKENAADEEVTEESAPEEKEEEVEQGVAQAPAEEDEEKITADLKVTGTESQLQSLKSYLVDSGLEFDLDY